MVLFKDLKWEETAPEAGEILFYLLPSSPPPPDLLPGLQGPGLAKSVSSEDSFVKPTRMAYMFSSRHGALRDWLFRARGRASPQEQLAVKL